MLPFSTYRAHQQPAARTACGIRSLERPTHQKETEYRQQGPQNGNFEGARLGYVVNRRLQSSFSTFGRTWSIFSEMSEGESKKRYQYARITKASPARSDFRCAVSSSKKDLATNGIFDAEVGIFCEKWAYNNRRNTKGDSFHCLYISGIG